MGGDHHGGAAGVGGLEELQHLGRPLRVEVPGGLVGEEDGGVAHQRPGDGGALLLPAGEAEREAPGAVLEPHPAERLGHAPGHLGGTHAFHLKWKGDVLRQGAVLEQLEVLEDHADGATHVRDGGGADPGHVPPEDQQLPGGGRLGAEDEPEQGGLPRAGRSGEEDELALADLQAHVGQRRSLGSVLLLHVEELDHRAPAPSPTAGAVVPGQVGQDHLVEGALGDEVLAEEGVVRPGRLLHHRRRGRGPPGAGPGRSRGPGCAAAPCGRTRRGPGSAGPPCAAPP